MGKRSLTRFKDSTGREVALMYRQFDGYLEGHGKELVDFLKGKKVINGISGQTLKEAFNGMGCLSAAVVAHFKGDDIGGIYLYPTSVSDAGQDYDYIVSVGGEAHRTSPILLKIMDGSTVVYDGPVDECDIEKLCAAEKS